MVRKKADGPVTAALLDVDGTLVDTNYLHAVTWWEAFAQAGHGRCRVRPACCGHAGAAG